MLITLIPALFRPADKSVIYCLRPQTEGWLSLSRSLRDSSFRHIKITGQATAGYIPISQYTLCSCFVWQVAASLQISTHSSSSLSPQVLNQWHPNSFTALFLCALGFTADAFGVKSFSSGAWPSLPHLRVCLTITHAICTNYSICVWI